MDKEKGVIKTVEKFGKYFPALKREPYMCMYNGNTYYADDTRELVFKICNGEGIPCRETGRTT